MTDNSRQITSLEIQLYLMGELKGSIAEEISRIENLNDKHLTPSEIFVKKELQAIKSVDDLLSHSISNSFSMPKVLEEKLEARLHVARSPNKIERYLKQAKEWLAESIINSFGGGISVAFAVLVLIQIQSNLPVQILPNEQDVIQYRSSIIPDNDFGCFDSDQGVWQTNTKLLLKVVGCSDEKESFVIKDGQSVKIGQKFNVGLIPIAQGVITIEYITSNNDRILVATLENAQIGKELFVSNEGYEFAEPKGIDRLLIKHSDSLIASISLNVQ